MVDGVMDELKGEFLKTYGEALELLQGVQLSDSSSSVESDQLDTLDASLTSLLGAYLASIRRRRNALNFLACLSDEILETIFYFAVHSEPPPASLLPAPNPYSPAIRSSYESNRQALERKHRHTRFYLSHVCSRWRRLILADARIWSCIEYDSMSRRLAELSFERAGQAPLDVRFAPSFPNSSAVTALPKLLEQLSDRNNQLRSLEVLLPHVASVGTQDYPPLAPLLTGPLPLLQSLLIRSCHSTATTDPWSLEGSDLPLTALTTLCGGHAPLLSRLNLQSFILPWSLSSFTGLSSLILSHCTFRDPSPNEDFIQILRRLPSLRQLSLVNCKFLCAHHHHHHHLHPTGLDDLVELPHLQMMRLQDLSSEDTARILSSVRAPRQLRLSVKVGFEDAESANTFARMNFSLGNVLETVRDAQVTISDHGIGIHSVQLVGARVISGQKKNVHFDLNCVEAFFFESAASILGPLHIPQCHKLSVSWSDNISWGGPRVGGPAAHTSSDLAFIMRRCPSLERLMLLYPKNANTLDALTMRQSDTDANSMIVCPLLEALEIECSIGMNYDEQLLQVARMRCSRSQPGSWIRPHKLKQLVLKGTQILKPTTVENLREMVDEVFCGGEENDIAAFDGVHFISQVSWNTNGWGDGHVDAW